jgi:predicted nucleic acid-binding protein
VTTDKVVDASVVCTAIFTEPREAEARSLLAGADLFAPSLIDFEVANAALKKIRARPTERAQITALHAEFQNFSIEKCDVDFQAAIMLAEQEKLSFYDASYLWLALEMGAELVTLDEKLVKAYRRTAP